MRNMSKDKLRLICRCGTIWPVCDMPMDVDEMVLVIHDAKCPSCNKRAHTACVYMETAHERGEKPLGDRHK
jgi:hypothetical protein